MKIGLDLDETITEFPAFFALLAGALIDAGHQVHVITYRSPEPDGDNPATREELDGLGIRYTELHLPDGISDAPQWKARVASAVGLDLMIDDSPEVLAAMPAGV